MNDNFFQLAYLLPYLHIYLLVLMFLIFSSLAFIKNYRLFIYTNTPPNKPLAKSQDKQDKPIYKYFIFSQIVLGVISFMPFFLAGNGKFIFDRWIDDNFFSAYPSGLILILSFLAMWYVYEALAKIQKQAEFYASFYLCLIGLMLICISQHLLYLFAGLAITTIATYAMLAVSCKNFLAAQETSQFSSLIIYFVFASISLVFLAFGSSWIYGAVDSMLTFKFHNIITVNKTAFRPFLDIGTIFIIIAIAIQFGLTPFHQWVVKLYYTVDYPVAMLVMNITKIGVFSITMKLIITSLFSVAEYWKWMILIIALLSIVYGYLAMLGTKSFRKFLAFSAIANLGFVMLALFAVVEIRSGGVLLTSNAVNAISSDLYYLIYYQFTNVAVFAFIWVLAKKGNAIDDIYEFAGLNQRYPWFALMFATLMLSMAGIPPFWGFWAKLAITQALLSANHHIIIAIALLFSVIGAFAYLRFIKLMYFDHPIAGNENSITLAKPFRLVLSLHCLLLIGLGLFPAVTIQTAFLIMR